MKGDKKRKKTCFKKGYSPHNKGKVTESRQNTVTPIVKWKRLPHNISQCALRRAEKEPSTSSCFVRYLRPKVPGTYTYADKYKKAVIARPESDSYRIFHPAMTEKLWNTAVSEHRQLHPLCKGMLIFDNRKEMKVGLAWKESLKCTTCSYTSASHKLYKEVESPYSINPGPKPATLNAAVHTGLMTTSIGSTGFRNILLHMNIPVPSTSSMQRQANRASDIVTSVNEADMMTRRDNLIKMNADLGLESNAPVMVEADGRYNNALQAGAGKTPFQPATQCVYTVCENQTVDKQIIGINIKNKLCQNGQKYFAKQGKLLGHKGPMVCPNHPKPCTANLPIDSSIGDESQWCEETFKSMNNDKIPITVKYLTTDLDSRAGEALRTLKSQTGTDDLVNLKCSRHLSQSQRRRTQNTNFSETMFPGKTKQTRDSLQKNFSYDLTRRCTKEFNLCYQAYCGDINLMKKKFSHISQAVIMCIQGNHSNCKKHSFACTGLLKGKWNMSFMPQGSHLQLSECDKAQMKDLILLRLGEKATDATKFNTNTQKVESVNRAYSRTNPKNVTWSRNVNGRLHTAAHMLNCNFVNSTLSRLEAIGAPATAGSNVVRQMESVHAKNKYCKLYQQSIEHKKKKSCEA